MDRNKSRSQNDSYEGDVLVAEKAPSSAGSALNVDTYRAHIEEFDLTEEQTAELLGALWEIMKAFVDLGFGVDSIHHFVPALSDASRALKNAEVESKDIDFASKFEKAAFTSAEKEEET